jgi:hypothetical protein
MITENLLGSRLPFLHAMHIVNLYFIIGLMLTTRETGLTLTNANQARVQALIIIEKEIEIIAY